MNQILIVNDLPASGQVAGLIMQSILTASYLKTAWLPTVILSHHTGNGPVYRKVLTCEMQSILSDWINKEYSFSGIVTGYLGGAEQIKQLNLYLAHHLNSKPLIVDPVMADNGKFYQGFDQTVLPLMIELAKKADVILPNVTEACFLVESEYPSNIKLSFIEELLFRFKKAQFSRVILTGVVLDDSKDRIGFYYLDDSNQVKSFTHPRVNRHYFGTGDLATAIFSAFYFKKVEIEVALEKMCQWLPLATEHTNDLQVIDTSIVMYELMNYFR